MTNLEEVVFVENLNKKFFHIPANFKSVLLISLGKEDETKKNERLSKTDW
jgi:hypothetical protein